MYCGYCGKAHTSNNDRCRGCGVSKSSRTVSTKAIRKKKLRARVAEPKQLNRVFTDIPVINFIIGLGAAASPIIGYFTLLQIQVHYQGSELVSSFVMLVTALFFLALLVRLFESD